MSIRTKILLWSKYSPKSSYLLKSIKDSNVQFNLDSLCIDNKDIKKRVCEDKNYEIKSVPCLLIMYTNGVVEKYDGDRIFDWFNNSIKENRVLDPEPEPEPEPDPDSEPEPKSFVKKELTELEINRRKYHKIINLEEKEDDENIKNNSTSIEDLEDEELDDLSSTNHSDRFRNSVDLSRINVDTTEQPKTAIQKKTINIMNKAKLLQNGRS
jgi:hypothetical protein